MWQQHSHSDTKWPFYISTIAERQLFNKRHILYYTHSVDSMDSIGLNLVLLI